MHKLCRYNRSARINIFHLDNILWYFTVFFSLADSQKLVVTILIIMRMIVCIKMELFWYLTKIL